MDQVPALLNPHLSAFSRGDGTLQRQVEPIAAGVVAGAARTGILGQVLEGFVLDGGWAVEVAAK